VKLNINFKDNDINLWGDWRTLLIKNPHLSLIVLSLAEKWNGQLTITSIYRGENDNSVHKYWHGVDIRTRGREKTALKAAVSYINRRFPYGKKGIKTAIYGTKGHFDHIHLQNMNV